MDEILAKLFVGVVALGFVVGIVREVRRWRQKNEEGCDPLRGLFRNEIG